MKSLVRNIVLLLTSVLLFLTGLGLVLWISHTGFNRHSQLGNEFLAPSQIHVAQSQHIVGKLVIEIHSDSLSPRPPGTVPYRFRVIGALDQIEQHLARVVRLTHAFDYEDAFDLPTRAFQFQWTRSLPWK